LTQTANRLHPPEGFLDAVADPLTDPIAGMASGARIQRRCQTSSENSSLMAARIGKLVGNGAGIWLRLQARCDTWEAQHRLKKELARIPTAKSDVSSNR
jgi:plasmid maintenance system antidote protein VapI